MKRTPRNHFDPLAKNRDDDKDWEPEKVVGKDWGTHPFSGEAEDVRVQLYKVRWKGFSSAHDTWEPIGHLAGCADLSMISSGD